MGAKVLEVDLAAALGAEVDGFAPVGAESVERYAQGRQPRPAGRGNLRGIGLLPGEPPEAVELGE